MPYYIDLPLPLTIAILYFIHMHTLSCDCPAYSESYAAKVYKSILDNQTFDVSHYHAHYYSVEDSGTTHVSVLSPDGQAVSVTS